jgi:hypothetical protein
MNLPQKLNEYWQTHPHLRLGQIVVNAWRASLAYKNNPEPEIADLFYLPDSELLAGLEKLEELNRESSRKKSSQN